MDSRQWLVGLGWDSDPGVDRTWSRPPSIDTIATAGHGRRGSATASFSVSGRCWCAATAASRWSIRSRPIRLTNRSIGLGSIFRSATSASSSAACLYETLLTPA